MTETNKAKRKQPARKGKAGAQPQERTVTIPFPDTDSEEEANRILEKKIPDWEALDKDERSEFRRLLSEHRKRGIPVKVKLSRKSDGGYRADPDGKSEMLALLKLHQTFAANSMDPINARANEIINYLETVGVASEGRYNAALSFIESMAPRDQMEALLLVQMYLTHDAAIRSLCQLGDAQWIPNAQTFGNLAAKLLRISQGQMETLSRLRRGGEQVVKHVHVDNRGGQAVIAENVNQGGGTAKSEDQCHGAENTGCGPAMLGQDAQGIGVPISSRERAEAVQDARRDESRRA